MKIRLDGGMTWGDYTEKQIDLIVEEMKKPQDKRRYLLGIEFSMVKEVEVIK